MSDILHKWIEDSNPHWLNPINERVLRTLYRDDSVSPQRVSYSTYRFLWSCIFEKAETSKNLEELIDYLVSIMPPCAQAENHEIS